MSDVCTIGFDPGLQAMGWGAVSVQGGKARYIASGTTKTKAHQKMGERLAFIRADVAKQLEFFKPQNAAIEAVFFGKDPQAAFKLGQAYAVITLACYEAGVELVSYAPNHIKKCVVGRGHATKEDVQATLKLLLPDAQFGSHHASDATCVALAHAFEYKFRRAVASGQ